MRVAGIIVAIILASSSMALAAQAARSIDKTLICPTEADFMRYATLLKDDITAAVAYEIDHHCVMIEPGTLLRIDKGSLQAPTNMVCVRPVGSYDCFWTFAAHIKAEDSR